MLKKLAFSFLFLFGCSYVQSEEGFSHLIIKLPYDYQINYPWVRVIDSIAELEAFYGELTEGLGHSNLELLPMPVVNFEDYTLIAGGLGFQTTGAVSLAIGTVGNAEHGVYIEAYRVMPGPYCMVTDDIGYPTVGILVKKTNKQVMVNLKDASYSCLDQ